MAEAAIIVFTHKEVVEALLRKQGIHEGIWALWVKFGLKAINVGSSDTDVSPAAVLAILELGLQKADKETSIAVDAAKTNPKPKKRVRKK